MTPIHARSWWRRMRLLIAAGSLLIPAALAHAQEDADRDPVSPDQPVASAPRLEDLPGELLLASTRASAQPGDSVDKYRLFTLKHGELSHVAVPDEALGSTSASVSQNGQRLLLNAGGQVLYVLDMTGATPPRQLLDRLPPLALGQTNTYLSVSLSPDGSRAIINQPHPVGMTLVAVTDGTASPVPLVGQYPTFSPDASQVALSFSAPGAPTAAIFASGLGGPAGLTKLSGSTDYETAPQWLADGSGVVYVTASAQWQVREVTSGSSTPIVLAQAPDGYVISDVAMAPGNAWVAYTLQSKTQLHRYVHIASTSDASLGLDLPQDVPWNDRVLAWVSGPDGA
jgi:hypothetical protein